MRNTRLRIYLWLGLTFALGTAAGAATEYDFKFHLYPNPFFTAEANAQFSYYLPSDGTVSIYVYDFDGAPVRTVVENYPQAYGFHDKELSWNGADDRGEVVGPAPYVIVFEATIAGVTYRDTFVAVVNR
jgi:hypothetical protein